MHKPVLLNIVAASGAGKGVLLRSIRDMCGRYISIIPKATNRERRATDGDEIVGYADGNFPSYYDIIYGNYTNKYGIPTKAIWDCFQNGKHAFLICSNFKSVNKDGKRLKGFDDAIPKLKKFFGPALKLVYLFSLINPTVSKAHHNQIAVDDPKEIDIRNQKINTVNQYYFDNIEYFDHVLLNIKEPEDLNDQLFRLILYYNGDK